MTENFRHQQRAKLEEERRAVQDVTRAQYMQVVRRSIFLANRNSGKLNFCHFEFRSNKSRLTF